MHSYTNDDYFHGKASEVVQIMDIAEDMSSNLI